MAKKAKTKNKNIESAEKFKNLYLVGEITDMMSKYVILELLDDPKILEIDTLNIYMQTNGGCLHSCFTILDLIEYQKEILGYKVNVYGLGEIASGGLFILLIGDNRLVFPSTRVFVHEHVVIDPEGEPYTEKMKSLKEDIALHKIYTNYIARRLNMGKKKVNDFLRLNKWLSQKELLEYKIITGEIKCPKKKK